MDVVAPGVEAAMRLCIALCRAEMIIGCKMCYYYAEPGVESSCLNPI